MQKMIELDIIEVFPLNYISTTIAVHSTYMVRVEHSIPICTCLMDILYSRWLLILFAANSLKVHFLCIMLSVFSADQYEGGVFISSLHSSYHYPSNIQ